jgi:hypothetical protein
MRRLQLLSLLAVSNQALFRLLPPPASLLQLALVFGSPLANVEDVLAVEEFRLFLFRCWQQSK